jgi:hypothetical protein
MDLEKREKFTLDLVLSPSQGIPCDASISECRRRSLFGLPRLDFGVFSETVSIIGVILRGKWRSGYQVQKLDPFLLSLFSHGLS